MKSFLLLGFAVLLSPTDGITADTSTAQESAFLEDQADAVAEASKRCTMPSDMEPIEGADLGKPTGWRCRPIRSSAINAAVSETLQVGDRIRVGGSYFIGSAWLPEGESRDGTLLQFIPGQNTTPAAVIKLDAPITAEGVTGDILVLELRSAGARWDRTETVHVELCDFTPEPKKWQDRRQGKWVESHATYERIQPDP